MLIMNKSQMLVMLKILTIEAHDHLWNGRRRGRGDGEQSRSTSFSGFLTPSSILSRLFFQFELLQSITSCVQTPLIDKKRKDGLLRMVIASFYKCLHIKVTYYKYFFAHMPLPSGNFESSQFECDISASVDDSDAGTVRALVRWR